MLRRNEAKIAKKRDVKVEKHANPIGQGRRGKVVFLKDERTKEL
jgi:hypothetical protein